MKKLRVREEGDKIIIDKPNSLFRFTMPKISVEDALRAEIADLKFTAEEWERQYNHRMEMDQAELDAVKAELAAANKRIHMLRADLFEVIEDQL